MSKHNMTWNQRFALIDHYQPSDKQICSAFGVQQNELDTARQLRSTGQFIPASDVDVVSYASLFELPTSKEGSTSIKRTSPTSAPITATKRMPEPKKRGRKGDKIKNAFAAIPTTATPAEDFAQKRGVSLTVLRQSKRFDPQHDAGKVHVKKVVMKEGEEKVLAIWREG